MHIERTPTGRFRVTAQHRGKRASQTCDTEIEATMAGHALMIELGGRRKASAMSVAQMLAAWIETRDHSPTYRADVLRVIAFLPGHFTSRVAAEVDTDVIDALYRKITRERSAHRARRAHSILLPAFAMAVRYRWADRNPCVDAALPSTDARDVTAPDAKAVRALLAGLSGPLALFVHLAAVTGCRRGELLGLQWGDVQDGSVIVRRSVAYTPAAGTHIRPTKTGSKGHRVIALDPATAQLLTVERARQREASMKRGSGKPTWLFSHDGAGPWRPDYVTLEFIRARRRLGAPESLTLHSLRHFVATQLLAAGVPVTEVAGRLGHTTTNTTTRTYRHYVPAADQVSATTIAGILAGGEL